MRKPILIIIFLGLLLFLAVLLKQSLLLYALRPVYGVSCLLEGGYLVKQGFVGIDCRKHMSDEGKRCFKSQDCLSKKCVISYSDSSKVHQVGDGYNDYELNQDVYGICSDNNQETCFSHEIIITNQRRVGPRGICD